MMVATESSPWPEQAAKVNQFVAHSGNEAYRSLAYHAALPLVLTPELVHYLRIQFLRDENVPWEAEVDLLLSDLCSQAGYELYAMDTQVRAYLLAQIKDDPVWQHRMKEVAQVLINYVSYLSHLNPERRQKELDAQRLAAMTYLGDEPCQQAVQEIANRLKSLENQAANAETSDRGIRAELAYLSRLTQELEPQLRGNEELLDLAQLVQRLLRNPEAVNPDEIVRSFRVGDYDDLTPSAYPFRTVSREQERLTAEFPPPKTLTFETGQFVEPLVAGSLPPLRSETVEVITIEVAPVSPDPSIPSTELVTFGFEVATLEPDRNRPHVWTVRKQRRQAQRYIERLGNSIFIAMVAIPGGSFVMGSPIDEPERFEREGPRRDVQVSSFLMGRYPITQIQWRAVAAMPQQQRELNPAPSRFQGDNHPVERVSWYDAIEFCARLSAHTGREYRLPAEAEWEYACRARTTTPFSFGDMITPEVANYNGSYAYNNGPNGENRGETTPVDHFKIANGFGLSDMHGNVYEWCQDQYHDNYAGAPKDSRAWKEEEAEENARHILRGGAWDFNPGFCRSAYRYLNAPLGSNPYIGFRVVCVAPRALA
ncbi:MAG: SUMF1/EgtB/PvdO family nonheme iron enzyme [Cyanobacteria bacterium J06638_6]